MADPVRPLDLTRIMRHAFTSGFAAGRSQPGTEGVAWSNYDPTPNEAFQRIDHFLSPSDADDAELKLSLEISAELRRARAKFPGPDATLAALMEEVGEVAKATVDESRERVRKEAVQVAVMAIRLILDGDATLDEFRRSKGLDPLIGP